MELCDFFFASGTPDVPLGDLRRESSRAGYGTGSKAVVASYIGMSPQKVDHYRKRAEECCRRALIAEDVDQASHWLEAAARWLSLGRQEGVVLPRQTHLLP